MRGMVLIGMICCSLFLSGTKLNAQVKEVLVDLQHSEIALNTLLKEIKRDYKVKFAFDSRALSALVVSVDVNQKSLDKVLEDLLQDSGYSWRLMGNTRVIYPIFKASSTDVPKRFDFTFSTTVIDELTGEPLPFSGVRLADGRVFATNTDGQITIFHFPSDTSRITISFIGYKDLTFQITPEFVLHAKSVKMARDRAVLPIVAVVGEQRRMLKTSRVSGLEVVNMNDLDILPKIAGNDVIRSLQLLPGISGTEESSGMLHIRGGRSDENLVVLDGFTLYHLDHFYGIFSAFNGESIKSTRVHKGWFPSNFGGRAAGVVEITGKEGDKKNNRISVGSNMFSSDILLEIPLIVDEVSLLIAGRRSFTDLVGSPVYKKLFKGLYNESITVGGQDVVDPFSGNNSPDFHFYDLTSKLSIRARSGELFQASFYSGRDKLNIQYPLFLPDQQLNINYSDMSAWGNQGGSVRWNKKWSKIKQTSLIGSYSVYKSSLNATDKVEDLFFGVIDSVFTNQGMKLSEANVKFSYTHLLENHRVNSGLDLKFNELSYEELDSEGLRYHLVEKQPSLGWFIQDEFVVKDKLDGNVGVRWTYYTGSNTLYFEPRFHLSYRVAQNLVLNASYGRFVQTIRRIRPQNLFLNSPDIWRLSNYGEMPVLRTRQYQSGVIWTKNNWTVDVEAYFKSSQGVIASFARYHQDLETSLFDISQGTGRALGLEALIQKETGKHTGWMSFTLSHASHQFTDIPYRVVASYDQLFEGKLAYVFKLPGWSFSSTFVFGSGRPYSPILGDFDLMLLGNDARNFPALGRINSARLQPYHRMDLGVNYEFKVGEADALLGVSIFNVYNHVNVKNKNYFVTETNQSQISIISRDVLMTGFLPSLSFKISY